MKPTCCGKPATPYQKSYEHWAFRLSTGEVMIIPTFETGFRCKRCGAIRLPTGKVFDAAYMNSLEGVRGEGMKFDL